MYRVETQRIAVSIIMIEYGDLLSFAGLAVVTTKSSPPPSPFKFRRGGTMALAII